MAIRCKICGRCVEATQEAMELRLCGYCTGDLGEDTPECFDGSPCERVDNDCLACEWMSPAELFDEHFVKNFPEDKTEGSKKGEL